MKNMSDAALWTFKYHDKYLEDKFISERDTPAGSSKNHSRRSIKYELSSIQSSASNTSLPPLDDTNCKKSLYATKIPRYQEKGLVFVWPQRRRFYHTRELINITWFLAHALYFLHIMHLFPSGTAVPMKRPPWRYIPPLPKPENRDYIIEPDWDS